MNGYVAIWKNKRIDVYETTSYRAQEKAKEIFQSETRKKVNGWDIALALCELNGKQVIHKPIE